MHSRLVRAELQDASAATTSINCLGYKLDPVRPALKLEPLALLETCGRMTEEFEAKVSNGHSMMTLLSGSPSEVIPSRPTSTDRLEFSGHVLAITAVSAILTFECREL